MRTLNLKTGLATLLAGVSVSISSVHALERLEPPGGCYLGVSLGAGETIDRFSFRLGLRPAVYGDFFEFPLTAGSRSNLVGFLKRVMPTKGIAMVTLEPYVGLSNVTEEACLEFAQLCSDQETLGIGGIMVRFAHEMNGNWNPWGQQPVLYREKFRLLAKHVRAKTARSAMLWAPSYGGGYPFGDNGVPPGTPDFAALDTNGDGVLSQDDDMYEPYYPGDDAADWVGLTLYHWGVQWPWIENELPEANSFADLLTGRYLGGNGDQTAVPDFYAGYCGEGGHNKPLAIPETAAFFNPHQGGASELAIKQAWWGQVFNISGDTPEAADVALHFPKLKCVCWFDYYKLEPEQNQWIDWRISAYAPVRSAFVRHVRTLRNGRPWFLTAEDFDCLQRPDCIRGNSLPAILPLTGPVTLSLFTRAGTNCEIVVDLLDQNLRRQGGTRGALSAGERAVALTFTIDRPLVDGATYHWNIWLRSDDSNAPQTFASFDSLPVVARAITPALQIVAFPPVLASPSNFTVRVKYSAAEPAVVVVNLVDNDYKWHGGGIVTVDRGEGLLDVPVVLRPRVTNGNYVLESFLSGSSTNWQTPMARSPNFPVRVVSAVEQETINAVAQPATIPAGEVFRFTVDYAAVTNRDLHIDLFDVNTNFLAGALQRVPPGSGTIDMTISYPRARPGEYFLTGFITPVGESWTQALGWSADRRVTVVGLDYQQWLESYWGIVFENDPVNLEDDPDRDGASNADEFAALTDPRTATDVLKMEMARTGVGLTVRWRSVAGRRYQLFRTADLSGGAWTPAGGPVTGTGTRLQTAIPSDGAPQFYRVRVLP